MSQTLDNQTSSFRSANQANGVTKHRLALLKELIEWPAAAAARVSTREDLPISERLAVVKEPDWSKSCTTSRKMGVFVGGLPLTTKVDKLEKFMEGGKAPHQRLRKEHRPEDFHLHYYQRPDGNETTGEGVYVWPKGSNLESHSEMIHRLPIDKKHRLSSCIVPICFDCHFPINSKEIPIRDYLHGWRSSDGVPASRCRNYEEASSLDDNVCEMCLPSPILCCCCDEVLTKEDDPHNMAKVMGQFACKSCWKNSGIQCSWRYSEKNKHIDALPSYVERLYLSDEAIEREKRLLGGVPRKPNKDTTPFLEAISIRNLIDPTHRDYWPFGMDSQEYLEHKALMDFNNPIQETPDEGWRKVEVTEEVISNYFRDMAAAYEKYGYSAEDKGTLPEEIISGGCKYRFVGQCHGFTCDSSICQAVFQHHEDNDGGAFAALIATNIPIFTTRPGNIHGSAREAGFGQERCIACISKSFHYSPSISN